MQDAEPAFVAQGPFSRLRELQRLLSDDDIASDVVQPPGCNANA